MCCRLRLDTGTRKRGGGLFGSNPMTGSIGVVTINLPIAYLSKSESEFRIRLWQLINVAKNSLEIKEDRGEPDGERALPVFEHYLRGIRKQTGQYWYNHFNTIGLIGMNEACMNLLGREKDLTTPEGQEFAIRTLNYMRDVIKDIRKRPVTTTTSKRRPLKA